LKTPKPFYIFLAILGFLGWIILYVFQHELFYDPFKDYPIPIDRNGHIFLPPIETGKFILNKVFRYLLNDLCGILIVYGLFQRKEFIKLSFYIMLFGLIFILPIYFILVFNFFTQVFPFLNHIHRLVMNPVLMLIIIPAFYYQIKNEKE